MELYPPQTLYVSHTIVSMNGIFLVRPKLPFKFLLPQYLYKRYSRGETDCGASFAATKQANTHFDKLGQSTRATESKIWFKGRWKY